MNSDPTSDDDSSSDSSSVPAKRIRTETFGALSTTSGSDSEDEETPNNFMHNQIGNNENGKKSKYSEQSSEGNSRLSRGSSIEPYDMHSGTFKEDDELSVRPSYDNINESVFYNKHSDQIDNNDDGLNGQYSEKSKRMMSNMGFKPGKGLGKFEHGRLEPVSASKQKGKRGLGFQASAVGEAPTDFKWTPDNSVPIATEEVVWMPTPPPEPPSGAVLNEWLLKGPKKLELEDETNFVEPNILKGVLKSKSIFDTLDDEDLRHARFRSNPYETIGAVIFLNRAAVKMANLDAVFDFMFTDPRKPNGQPAVDSKNILYFADVCAGPGGFSEYVLYRKGWGAKGFGFTLKGPNDFKLSDFYAGTPETFNTYYGVNDDGNIYDPANLTSLKDFVLKQTEDQGVHFLMADGGFSVKGQENIQEILSKQLCLCQCLAALMLVRTGGHFVVKMFDVFTLFSVSLIYIMYRCFEKVCIHKPVTSRPANSERYLVCKWKKLGTESVEQHLFSVNSMLWTGLGHDEDITTLVPLNVLQEDKEFFSYMYNSNSMFSERQIEHLLKIAQFSKDKNLSEPNQAKMRLECLQLWKLPDQVRTQPPKLNPNETLTQILSTMDSRTSKSHNAHSFKTSLLGRMPVFLEKINDIGILKNVYDWHVTFLSSGKNSPDLKIILGCGRRVYTLEANGWNNLGLNINIPAKTLFYGEIVRELSGEGRHQMFNKAVHIIDAIMLGGVNIAHLSLTERLNKINLFCNALEKQTTTYNALRCKRYFNMETFSAAVANLEYRAMKTIKRAVTINVPSRIRRNDMYHVVGSVFFIKEVREPWTAQISKKTGVKYFFKMGLDRKPISEYVLLEEAQMDMLSAFTNRVIWPWGDAASAIFEGQPQVGISRLDMEEYIKQNMIR